MIQVILPKDTSGSIDFSKSVKKARTETQEEKVGETIVSGQSNITISVDEDGETTVSGASRTSQTSWAKPKTIQSAANEAKKDVKDLTAATVVDTSEPKKTNQIQNIVASALGKTNTSEEQKKLLQQLTTEAAKKGFGAFNEKGNLDAAHRLGEIMVCDMIAKEVQKAQAKGDIGSTVTTAVLINLYLGKSFGDQEFMGEVNKTVTESLNKFLTTSWQKGVYNMNKDLTKQVDNVIYKTETELNKGYTQASKFIEKVAKVDLQKSINDAIKDSLSMEGINRKLEGSFLGQCLKPGLNKLYNSGLQILTASIFQNGTFQEVSKLQKLIVDQQEFLNRQKKLILEQEKMIRQKIDEVKKQAEKVVLDYANKIIADISSKINIDLGSISGQLF